MTREQIQLVESTWAHVAEIKDRPRIGFPPEVHAAWASAYGLRAGAMKAAAQAKVA